MFSASRLKYIWTGNFFNCHKQKQTQTSAKQAFLGWSEALFWPIYVFPAPFRSIQFHCRLKQNVKIVIWSIDGWIENIFAARLKAFPPSIPSLVSRRQPESTLPLFRLYSWIFNWEHILIKFRRGCETFKIITHFNCFNFWRFCVCRRRKPHLWKLSRNAVMLSLDSNELVNVSLGTGTRKSKLPPRN